MRDVLKYNKYVNLKKSYENIVSRISNIRMFLFIIMVISFILKYYYYEFLFNVVFFISLVSFIIMLIVYDKYFMIYNYYEKYLLIIENYMARENGEWKKFKDNGSDFFSDNKHYLNDLDILGECSLFKYLSVCKTLGGREKLVEKLSNLEINRNDLEHNQKLVEELTNDIEFCIKFQVMISQYEDMNVNLSKSKDDFKNTIDRGFDFFIEIIASVICISLFILGILNIIPLAFFYGMFLFNIAISYLYFYIYRDDFNRLDNLVNNYSGLFSIIKFISIYKGKSFKMKNFIKSMNLGLVEINKLKELESINSLRNNLLSNFLFNGIFCLNLFVRVKYSIFLSKYFKELDKCISDIEELEAMISLATIGIVKKDVCMPSFNEKLVLNFKEIKHPLIDESICVSNSFDSKAGVNIITGSNMGGKTTFLRTIGINLILMQAGTYVCANNLEASYFKIFTSMRVMDNVEKGISTFYGELLRIKDMVEYNGQGNMLVLIDEIFKGTNYNDRMYGAKEVVKKLNNKSTIAFITTHDFELCESDNIKNYHVKEDYEGDKIIFDYKVRSGKCVSTNAKYLMDKLGIINIK